MILKRINNVFFTNLNSFKAFGEKSVQLELKACTWISNERQQMILTTIVIDLVIVGRVWKIVQ